MFSFGIMEVLFVLALMLIVLGPEHIPRMAKIIARSIHYLKSITDDVKNVVDFSEEESSSKTQKNKVYD